MAARGGTSDIIEPAEGPDDDEFAESLQSNRGINAISGRTDPRASIPRSLVGTRLLYLAAGCAFSGLISGITLIIVKDLF